MRIHISEMIPIITIAFILFTSSSGHSSTIFFEEKSSHIKLEGKIKLGDFNKLKKAILAFHTAKKQIPLRVDLNSEGGDLGEAIKMGNLLRSLYATTALPFVEMKDFNSERTKCFSSCFFIFVAGLERWYGGNLLISKDTYPEIPALRIHRPFYKKEYYSELSLNEAQDIYQKLNVIARRYLEKMGVSNKIIEKMFSVSSLESIPVTQDQFKDEIGEKVPFFAEWIIARCGQLSEQEGYAHTMLLVLSKENARKRFSNGYIEYLSKKADDISNCRQQAIVKVQRNRIEKLLL